MQPKFTKGPHIEQHRPHSHAKIEEAIYLIRGEKVMLDRDLAPLYGVETGALNRAVKRNLQRFPRDFMFQLTTNESDFLMMPNWHLKQRSGWQTFPPLRFHGTGSGDAFKRAEQRTCRISQH